MQYTRETIEQEFTVERDVIVSPGRFEGQPRYAPYFEAKTAARGKAVHSVRAEDVASSPS